MNKYLKIGLYVLLIIAITIVAMLMLGSNKPKNIETGLSPEFMQGETEEDTTPNSEEIIEESSPSFEEDVMQDLESFFGNTNGYENVGGEFGFTDGEIE